MFILSDLLMMRRKPQADLAPKIVLIQRSNTENKINVVSCQHCNGVTGNKKQS
jgi:hypothetical protein